MIDDRFKNRAQVPNPLQRTLKPYVDWDMQLSTIEQSQFFESFTEDDWMQHLQSDTLTITDIETARMLQFDSSKQQQQRPWKVEFVRRIGLCVPAVVCGMLKRMGCIGASEKDVFVAVKEGTRELLSSNDDGTTDWKISFHFVFQVTVLLTQFKCLYEMITSYIGNCVPHEFAVPECHNMESVMPNTKDLGFLLGQVALMQYEMYLLDAEAKMKSLRESVNSSSKSSNSPPPLARANIKNGSLSEAASAHSRILKNRAIHRLLSGTWNALNTSHRTAALVGMDMHPRSNAEQGLACLGSRKKGVSVGNRLLGMARVSLSSLEQMWVPEYESRTHKLLVATECSIVAPGPRCIALECDMHAWRPCPWEISSKHLRGLVDEQQTMHHHHAPTIVQPASAAAVEQPLDSSVQSCLLHMHHAEMRALALCRGLQTSRTKQQLQQMMTKIAAMSTPQQRSVHNRTRY